MRQTKSTTGKRRGAVLYTLVISISLVVSLISLTGLIRLRIDGRTRSRAADVLDARRHAESAIELAWLTMNDDADWRTTVQTPGYTAEHALFQGSYAVAFHDPTDGDWNDNKEDPVAMTATGKQGTARQMVQVTLDPVLAPLSSLDAAVMSGGDIVLNIGATISSNGIIASNDDVLSLGAQVAAPVEAAGSVLGWTFQQGQSSGVDSRELPANEVFDYYAEHGTSLPIGSLPTASGYSVIQDVVLSPQNNPYGSGQTNAEGIYVVDCQNRAVRISNCRIVGTLVLLNVAGEVLVRNSVNWQPSETGYPCLLTDGSLRIDLAPNPLQESTSSVNFNPPGTPYQDVADGDLNDDYPTRITGLIYTRQSAVLRGQTTISGTLISRLGTTIEDSVTVTYRDESKRTPPPGFRKIARWKVREGSWTRQTD